MPIPDIAQVTALFGLILILVAGFVYFVRSWSDRTGDDREDASQMMTKFKELHAHGGLSDSEYRTIKSKLASELGAEIFATAKETASNNTSNRKSLPNPQSDWLNAEDWTEEGDSET